MAANASRLRAAQGAAPAADRGLNRSRARPAIAARRRSMPAEIRNWRAKATRVQCAAVDGQPSVVNAMWAPAMTRIVSGRPA